MYHLLQYMLKFKFSSHDDFSYPYKELTNIIWVIKLYLMLSLVI